MHSTVEAFMNPAGIYYDSHELLSDSGGDGLLNPGESATLDVTLVNHGPAALNSISATLSSTSPFVDITVADSSFPPLDQEAVGTSLTPFAINLDAAAPAAMDLELQINITADGNTVSFPFSLSVGSRTEYLNDSCEVEGEWTHAPSTGWADFWHLSSEDSQSGSHAWKAGSTSTGTYANHADSRLVTPPVELADWSRLSFVHRMDAETSSAFPDSAYDGGIVEISTNGVDWTQLAPLSGGYNAWFRAQSGGGAPASHNFQGGTPCFSGLFGWQPCEIDLSDWNGQTVQFGFRFGSDKGGAREVLYIDDLVLPGVIEETGIQIPPARPVAMELSAAPNPFNPGTRIHFRLSESARTRLSVYNLSGRLVERLLNDQPLAAGEHDLEWNAGALATGVYLLRLETPQGALTSKLFLLK